MANLYYGSSGDDVKTLQQNLNSVGNYGLDVDGAYGPKTQSAVRDFQTKSNIGVDGIVGNETRGALDAALAKLNPVPTTPVAAQPTGAAAPAASPTSTPLPPSQLSQTIRGIKVNPVDVPDAPDLRPELEQWLAAAQEQQTRQVDYATEKGVRDLQRAEEDAQPQFQKMRDQVSADEARALDNQALYAEARGDKGGIGQAQYGSIQNTAAQNRLQVNQAQTKLATDTARAIADLRAQGEFEKADKMLQLTQTYLSQLMSLEQWAAEYNLSAAQFKRSMEEWQADFQMKAAQVLEDQRQWEAGFRQDQLDAQNKNLASAGEALLGAGIMPSDSQLAAMGMTRQQAKDYIAAVQMSVAASAAGGGGGGSGGSSRSSSGGGSGRRYSDGGLGPDKVKALQRALGVDDDGIVGPMTYNAFKDLGYKSIAAAYEALVAAKKAPVAGPAAGAAAGAYAPWLLAGNTTGSGSNNPRGGGGRPKVNMTK